MVFTKPLIAGRANVAPQNHMLDAPLIRLRTSPQYALHGPKSTYLPRYISFRRLVVLVLLVLLVLLVDTFRFSSPRVPSLPVAMLAGHQSSVSAIAWAPHSSCHICTA